MHPQTTILIPLAALFLLVSAARLAHADHPTLQPSRTANSLTGFDGETQLGGSAAVRPIGSGFFTFSTDSLYTSIFGRREQRRGLFLANMSNHELTRSLTSDVIDAPIFDLLDIADRYVVCCGGDCVVTDGDQLFGSPEITERYVACTGGGRAFANGDQSFVGDPWQETTRDPQSIADIEPWVRVLSDAFETPILGEFKKSLAGVRTRPVNSRPYQERRMPRRTALQWGILLGVASPAVMIAMIILIGSHTQQSNIVLEILVGGLLILALGMAVLWLM